MAWDPLRAAIERATAGDSDARAVVVEICYPYVRRIVHRDLEQDFRRRHKWMLPLFSTQDVVHEVLAAAVRDLGETAFDGPEKLFAYLGTLVRHRLLDAVRYHEAARRDMGREVREATVGLAAMAADVRETTPTMAASLGERAGLVRDALQEMTERHRLLLELRLIDDKSFAELREALGYSSDETARQAFHDAHARLLVKLKKRGLGKAVR